MTRLMAVQSTETLTPEQVAKYNSQGGIICELAVDLLQNFWQSMC